MQEVEGKQNQNKTSFLIKVKRFFSSLKLAVILILILVGLCLVGAFLIQVPAEYTQNSIMYHYWLENVAQPTTGPWFTILNLLGFFNIFHSIWFLTTGVLLIISIIVCSLNRWNQIRTISSQKSLPMNAELFKNADNTILIPSQLNTSESLQRISKIFRKNRYTVKENNSKTGASVTADKNRFSPWGTYLIHLSLILFIAGFLVGNYFGFRDESFVVAEGETKSVGHGTQLSLRLDSFKDEYWDNGSPKDYSSLVAVLDNDQIAKQGLIRVNHPLSYNGVRFYQSFFGDAVVIEISDSQDKTLYHGSVLLSQTIDDHPYIRQAGFLQINESQIKVYVIGRATNMQDATLSENQIAVQVYQNGSNEPVIETILDKGVPFKGDQLSATYSTLAKYSGFQVSSDPGNAFIWIASFLLLLGLVMVFYFPRRQVLTLLETDSNEKVKIYLRSRPERKTGTAQYLQKLADDIKNELLIGEKVPHKEERG